jgi:hypothetical protein
MAISYSVVTYLQVIQDGDGQQRRHGVHHVPRDVQVPMPFTFLFRLLIIVDVFVFNVNFSRDNVNSLESPERGIDGSASVRTGGA